MRNFQDIILRWTQTYREIFKSALGYLQEHLRFKEHLRTTDSGYEVFSSNFLHVFQKHLELFQKDLFLK